MIYKIFLIDADNGIALLEKTFEEFKKSTIKDNILAKLFSTINGMINNIQEAMAKGRRVNEMNRAIESEDSIVIIYFHPLARVLFCSISDADDDMEKIKATLKKIGIRFWKKHQKDLTIYRTSAEKLHFEPFRTEIENYLLGGKIAEIFPKVLIIKSVLEKILTMGMIDEFELNVALKCDGKNSPLKISRMLDSSRMKIYDALKHLEELDIIKI